MTSLPNPIKTPALLQALQWIYDPIGYMEKAREQYGDIFTTKISGFGALVFVADPKANQQILTNDRKQFSAPGEVNRILQPIVGDRSLIMLNGEEHKQRRKLIMPSFHGERMQDYGRLIVNLTEKVFTNLPVGKTFVARSVTQTISLQVILETVFGLYEGERCDQLKRSISDLADIFRSPWTSAFLFFPWLQKDWGSWSPWGYLLKIQQEIDSLLYAEIIDRRQHPDPSRTDILSLLMAATDETGESLSDRELRDELMLLLFAGHETTATAMAWSLYWVHHHPEIYAKLTQELASLGDDPNPLAISRLPYLTAVCHETLRIYPVGMLTFPRVVLEPTEILGHRLEPYAVLAGCIYLNHHREDIYPESRQFKPERFLERQFSPYEFMPFGGGARRCVGEALAMFEMKLVLATLLTRYRLELASDQEEKPQRRGVTLAPASGVKMVLKDVLVPQVRDQTLVGSS
jgi:cytochrome P450 family 110